MNDEIKEILNKWKCYIGLTKKFTTNEYEMLRVEDIDKILDYITNLQEENEKLNNIIDELEQYLINMLCCSYDDNGAFKEVLDKLNELKDQ